MSTQPTPIKMATRNLSTTTDAPTTRPALPTAHWTVQWPAFDRDHDPTYLHTNDPTPTDATTLADFGGNAPGDPERPQVPVDDRDMTKQTSVFRYPEWWWRDADRLETLFHDRALEIGEISDLFGEDIGYEGVRDNLNKRGVRDPDDESKTGAAALESLNPEDAGLSPLQSDDSHAKYTKRGRSA